MGCKLAGQVKVVVVVVVRGGLEENIELVG